MKDSETTHSLTCTLETGEQTFKLLTTWNTIGRNNQRCNIIIPSASISKVHCKLLVNGDRGFIRDLGSKNGVYINDERIEDDAIKEFDIRKVKLEIADVCCQVKTSVPQQKVNNRPKETKVPSPGIKSSKKFREESQQESLQPPKKSIKTKQAIPKYLDQEQTHDEEKSITKQKPQKKNKKLKQITTERQMSDSQPVSYKRDKTKKQKSEDEPKRKSNKTTKPQKDHLSKQQPKNQLKSSHLTIILSGVNEEYEKHPIPDITIINKLSEDYQICVMPKYVRTIKLLYSICKGCHIVDLKWLKNCIKAQQLLPYDTALIGIPSHKTVIKKSVEKVKQGYRVFNQLQFCLFGSNFKCEKSSLEELIVAGGGKCITIRQLQYPKASTYIIIPDDVESLNKKLLTALNNYKQQGYQIHHVEMILDSCLKQDLQLENTRYVT